MLSETSPYEPHDRTSSDAHLLSAVSSNLGGLFNEHIYTESTDDDDDSIRRNDDDTSISAESSVASTIQYTQESFETFQHKIVQLATYLYPHVKPQEFKTTQMKGGTYNRIIGLSIPTLSPAKQCWRRLLRFICRVFGRTYTERYDDLIVRIPRLGGQSMAHDIATLEYVGTHLNIPIPRVTHYELSTENPIGHAYMIQTRLRGRNLNLVWGELSLAQKKDIASQITKLNATIAKETSSSAGVVSPSNSFTRSSFQVEIDKFHVPRPGQDVTKFARPQTWKAKPQTQLDFIIEQCDRWRGYQVSIDGDYWDEIWGGFVKIAHGLQELGFLSDSNTEGFHLCHLDLHSYNILVEVRDKQTVEVTAILDWDSAVFAPSFVAYRPPFWLWIGEDDENEDENNANLEPQSEEDRTLKQVFLDTTTPEQLKFAFAKEAILARRMFAILQLGFFSGWEVHAAESVIEEWNELHPDLKPDTIESDTFSNHLN